MWKWLTVACACYGLLGVAVAVAPESGFMRPDYGRRGQRENRPPRAPGYDPGAPRGPEEQRGPAGQPALQSQPGPDNRPPAGPAPTLLDFEGPLPQFLTRPEQPDSVQVIVEANGNHVLAWTALRPADGLPKAPLAGLEIPLTPGVGATQLRFRARAIQPEEQQPASGAGAYEFIVGVGEAGGGVYRARREIGSQFADFDIPLAELRRGPLDQDLAGAVDPARVDRFVVAYRLSYLVGKRVVFPVQLELDDIEVR